MIELTGTIDPASAAWTKAALDRASRERAPLAIVRLDTPGGLNESMREMVQAILAAPMPVVVYVGPDGPPAASAGRFVTLAADVAAMAAHDPRRAPQKAEMGTAPMEHPASQRHARRVVGLTSRRRPDEPIVTRTAPGAAARRRRVRAAGRRAGRHMTHRHDPSRADVDEPGHHRGPRRHPELRLAAIAVVLALVLLVVLLVF